MELEIQKEQPNSVEFGINAKGLYSGKVKVYAETIKEAMNQARNYATELENVIKLKNTPKEP